VTVEIEPDRIAIPDEPLQRDPIEETNGIFESLVAQGLRARIGSGNLLLGQRLVELDFVANAPPARLVLVKPYPELPTAAGGGFEEIASSAGRFFDKVSALPLDRLVGEIRNMVTHADGVFVSPDDRGSLPSRAIVALSWSAAELMLAKSGPTCLQLRQSAHQIVARQTLVA
jgi:paraquat-inducible protein B